jgi:hypothetical protein
MRVVIRGWEICKQKFREIMTYQTVYPKCHMNDSKWMLAEIAIEKACLTPIFRKGAGRNGD